MSSVGGGSPLAGGSQRLCVSTHAGPGQGWDVTQCSPSIRARTHARGPQRLFILGPDTWVAAPSP